MSKLGKKLIPLLIEFLKELECTIDEASIEAEVAAIKGTLPSPSSISFTVSSRSELTFTSFRALPLS